MSVFYLNNCGNVEKGDFVEKGNGLTIIIVWSLRTKNNMTFKIVDNYTGNVLDIKEANEPFDPFEKIKHPFTEFDVRRINTDLEQQSPAYREVMHKLFLQKLEEYIKEQWKMNSAR